MVLENITSPPACADAPLVSLNKWLAQADISDVTAWRWRKKGWLKTVNINGRLYLTAAAIREFIDRAERNEFAQTHKAPSRTEVQS